MKTKTPLLHAVAALFAAATVSLQGQSFQAQLKNPGIDPFLTYQGARGGGVLDYPAGVMNFTDVGTGIDFFAFCVEPLEDISYGELLVYDIQNTSTLANSEIIARLVGAYLSSAPTAENAAAVQWAIWEVTNETDPGDSLTAGSVRIISPGGSVVAALAEQYIADVMTYPIASLTYLTNPGNPGRQDVVTWNVVPEPSSAGLALVSGLLLLRRRRA